MFFKVHVDFYFSRKCQTPCMRLCSFSSETPTHKPQRLRLLAVLAPAALEGAAPAWPAAGRPSPRAALLLVRDPRDMADALSPLQDQEVI